MEIKITDSISIPCGNLGFILEASGHRKLYGRCVELERALKSDYDTFALNYRLVLEEFAMIEEVNRRIIESGMRFNEQTTRERITQEINRGYNGYSDLLIDLCLNCKNVYAIENLIKSKYSIPDNWDSEIFKTELEKYIRLIFRFASKNVHGGERAADLIPTNEVCRDYFRKLYNLLCAYYGHTAKFDGGLLPFRDYYPIPKSLRESLGIFLENRKQLYVKRRDDKNEYYLFVPADLKISDTQKRDIETIHRLWSDNIDYPQNVISTPIFVSNKNGEDYRSWVYPLPSLPKSLTDPYIETLTFGEKMQIIHGIVQGVASMHNSEPPFYHRSLSPSAFLVCKVRNGLKPLLINFDCAKDTDDGAEYTVFYAVSDKLSDEEMRHSVFAPELYDELESDDVDWAKVDIYALGKTIVKIITNSYELPDNKPDEITREQYNMILSSCNKEYSVRPDIDSVAEVF